MTTIQDFENAPMTFYKKPIAIEAMRFAGTFAEAIAVYHWIEKNTAGSFEPLAVLEGKEPAPESGVAIDPRDGRLIIATLEGLHWANVGDWIIRGVAGEFYPCKPEIFTATYDGPVMNDVIEQAARLLSTLTTCDGHPHATELHRRQARALADAGLLARHLPDRDKIKKALHLEFGSFLAHAPAYSDRFWGQAADAVLAFLTDGQRP